MRRATVTRKSKETNITIVLNLDGRGQASAKTGMPFLDHMLVLFGTHGLLDLTVKARGDLKIDRHHTNEDIGLVLGKAVDQALGERKGITRFGAAYVPMDEALARVVLDISGRPKLVLTDARAKGVPKALSSSTDYSWGDAEHFLESFARTAKVTLHVDVLAGSDFHHACEAVFKALGRAFEQAARLHPRVKGVPSSKGSL
jgi:imidazoleglycerol-phosphate dehydratase